MKRKKKEREAEPKNFIRDLGKKVRECKESSVFIERIIRAVCICQEWLC